MDTTRHTSARGPTSDMGRYCCKSLFGVTNENFRAADASYARRREGPYRFTQNRSPTSVVVLKSDPQLRSPKINFREIFGVVRISTCNNVGQKATSTNGYSIPLFPQRTDISGQEGHVRFVPPFGPTRPISQCLFSEAEQAELIKTLAKRPEPAIEVKRRTCREHSSHFGLFAPMQVQHRRNRAPETELCWLFPSKIILAGKARAHPVALVVKELALEESAALLIRHLTVFDLRSSCTRSNVLRMASCSPLNHLPA